MRVYLAGPDVFLPNPLKAADAKQKICHKYGFTGIFPWDDQLNLNNLNLKEAAIAIYQSNLKLMDSCDLTIASMTPFRGTSMDVGTSFEIGYMTAQGKPVFGYTNDGRLYAERVVESSPMLDEKGLAIEQFDMIDNLMVEAAIITSGGVIKSQQVEPEKYYTELKVFAEVVQVAAERLLKN